MKHDGLHSNDSSKRSLSSQSNQVSAPLPATGGGGEIGPCLEDLETAPTIQLDLHLGCQ